MAAVEKAWEDRDGCNWLQRQAFEVDSAMLASLQCGAGRPSDKPSASARATKLLERKAYAVLSTILADMGA